MGKVWKVSVWLNSPWPFPLTAATRTSYVVFGSSPVSTTVARETQDQEFMSLGNTVHGDYHSRRYQSKSVHKRAKNHIWFLLWNWMLSLMTWFYITQWKEPELIFMKVILYLHIKSPRCIKPHRQRHFFIPFSVKECDLRSQWSKNLASSYQWRSIFFFILQIQGQK